MFKSRNNFYMTKILQFHNFKVYKQVCFPFCFSISTVLFRHHHQLASEYSPPSCPPSPWLLLTYYLSPSSPFPHISMESEFVPFHIWFCLLSIVFKASSHCVLYQNFIPFMAKYYSTLWLYQILSIHHLMDIWLTSTFWPL